MKSSEYAVSVPSADDVTEDNTNVTLTASNVYNVMPNGVDTQATLFQNCETKPDNLGFKGLTVDDNYVYVASWETGYILEWSRDGSALDTPRAVCALEATRCQLNKCTEVNPNWYTAKRPKRALLPRWVQSTKRHAPLSLRASNRQQYAPYDAGPQQ